MFIQQKREIQVAENVSVTQFTLSVFTRAKYNNRLTYNKLYSTTAKLAGHLRPISQGKENVNIRTQTTKEVSYSHDRTLRHQWPGNFFYALDLFKTLSGSTYFKQIPSVNKEISFCRIIHIKDPA